MSPALRCALAEDEPEARRNVAGYLATLPGVELVGSAADGPQAVALVDEARPELLLLDIRLPEWDGFEVLRRVRHRPEVVFTTAYDQYAVSAFELGALDYLVKPFGRERLAVAIERVRGRLRGDGAAEPGLARGEGADAVERALATAARPLRRLFARKAGRIVPISAADIVRISANGDYSEIHAGRDRYLVEVSLGELERCLDPERFARLHRSHLVNLDAVEYLSPADDRRLMVMLKDGTRLVASRAGSERIRRRVR